MLNAQPYYFSFVDYNKTFSDNQELKPEDYTAYAAQVSTLPTAN